MDYLSILKEKGHERDMCMRAIIEHFLSTPIGTVIHKDTVARLPLKQWNARKNMWVSFTVDTVCRKARALAEMGILQKDNLGTRRSTRYWLAGGINPTKKVVEYVMVERDGVRYARPVYG